MPGPTRRLLIGAALALPGLAQAQAPWPSRPIRLINPWTPGGPADVVARPVAQKLSESLGQPVVMENRPGANGTIGAAAVARAAPDGYTLFFSHVGPIAISPNFSASVPFDPVRDFAPVTQLVSGPIVLVVRPDVPANSVAELLALARAQPGALSYGSVGPASTTHLAGEMLAMMGGVQLLHVPYQGAAPVVTDLLGGRLHFAFINFAGAVAQMQAGTLRAIAVSTERRSSGLPNLPTVAETLPGFEVNSWYGVMAPANTPAAIVDRLHRDIAAALRAPDLAAALRAQGFDIEATTPAQYAAKIAADLQRWGELARATGIKVG
ncbi:Bug family tripartite tricarboxylate transporter substrate binding protein [Falsiroseomonas ponticola]|uniref:Bug family tripartite tricarboxylate transporter substrate binding protein n=1 Tax=Falsiroseomonas ponticola TaxID=2786951 RepID=UPI001932F8DC|nr:tripartite tricarboxylate transporter substrate binding protein [Roseomonas ponticola]